MRNRPLCGGCLIVFLLMILGITMGRERFVKEFRPSPLTELYGKAGVRLEGKVYDIDQKENYQILFLKNISIIYQNKSFKESKIIIHDEEKVNIEIGNQILITGEITPYERERNAGNFNQKLYYQKQDIHAFVRADTVEILWDSVDEPRNFLYHFRQQWKNMLCDGMGKEAGAILSAMLLAEKAMMSEEIRELYQANGIAHLLSISGLHLSIIGVGLYKIFRRLSGSFLIGGGLGISFLLLYILMIGITVSVLRATVMYLFYAGADITGRHYDRITALTVAAVVTLLWRPLYLYDGGFWLSYSAVLAMMLVLPMFENLPCQGLWASMSINIVTIPILLYCFFEVPLYSVLLNMVVIPLMTIVLFSGILGSILCLCFASDGIFGMTGIGKIFMWICQSVYWLYEKLCEIFLELPMARIVTGKPDEWKIGCYYICLLSLIFLYKKRKAMLPGILLLLLSFIFLFLPSPSRKMIEITMLDVGQGDGILVQGLHGITCFIDGGSSDVKNVGKYRIEPFLKCQGIRKLDYVFLSHGDSDHVNGIEEMIERRKIGIIIETIILPDKRFWDDEIIKLVKKAMDAGIRVMVMEAGDELETGGFVIKCMAPVKALNQKAYYETSNAASMVLALQYEEFDMLFTGDVEMEGEKQLIKTLKTERPNCEWEILKVAHHGSKNSSSEEFMDILRPEYALISAGRDNVYGHPHDETLERIKKYESKVVSTHEKGALRVVTDGYRMKVEGYLE